MISTGKKARQKFGTRAAAKAAKRSKRQRKAFGSLPVSCIRKNTEAFIRGREF